MGHLFEVYSRFCPHSFQNYGLEHFWIFHRLPYRRDWIFPIYWKFNSSRIVPSVSLVLRNVVNFMKKLSKSLWRWQPFCWWFGWTFLFSSIRFINVKLVILLAVSTLRLPVFSLLKLIWGDWLHFYWRFGLAFGMMAFRDLIWIEVQISSLIIIESSICCPDTSMWQSLRAYSLSLRALLSKLILELKCSYLCAEVLASLIRKPLWFSERVGGLGGWLVEYMMDVLRISMSVVIHQYLDSWRLIDFILTVERKIKFILLFSILLFKIIYLLAFWFLVSDYSRQDMKMINGYWNAQTISLVVN